MKVYKLSPVQTSKFSLTTFPCQGKFDSLYSNTWPFFLDLYIDLDSLEILSPVAVGTKT